MKTVSADKLFTPIQVGPLELKHRVVMSPLTRSRSVQPGSVPGDLLQPSPHRALEIRESPGIVEDYRKATERAKAAGFDGVELHAGNGYLPDQFLQDGINKRTDMYGGSIETRSRFLLQVVEAMVSVWGGNHVAVRIAPGGTWNGVSDSNPIALLTTSQSN